MAKTTINNGSATNQRNRTRSVGRGCVVADNQHSPIHNAALHKSVV